MHARALSVWIAEGAEIGQPAVEFFGQCDEALVVQRDEAAGTVFHEFEQLVQTEHGVVINTQFAAGREPVTLALDRQAHLPKTILRADAEFLALRPGDDNTAGAGLFLQLQQQFETAVRCGQRPFAMRLFGVVQCGTGRSQRTCLTALGCQIAARLQALAADFGNHAVAAVAGRVARTVAAERLYQNLQLETVTIRQQMDKETRVGIHLFGIGRAAADIRLHRNGRRNRAERAQYLLMSFVRYGQAAADNGGDAPVLFADRIDAQAGRRFLFDQHRLVICIQCGLQGQFQFALAFLDQQLWFAAQQFDTRLRCIAPEHERVANKSECRLVAVDIVTRPLVIRCTDTNGRRHTLILRRQETECRGFFAQALQCDRATTGPVAARVALLLAWLDDDAVPLWFIADQPDQTSLILGLGRRGIWLVQRDQCVELALPGLLPHEPIASIGEVMACTQCRSLLAIARFLLPVQQFRSLRGNPVEAGGFGLLDHIDQHGPLRRRRRQAEPIAHQPVEQPRQQRIRHGKVRAQRAFRRHGAGQHLA